MLHSPIDNTVGIESPTEIFTSALHPRGFVSLHDADHLPSDEADSRYSGSVIGTWVTRYLD